MGASLWDQVGLPLLIGLAIQIVVIFLGFLSIRLWNCFIKQLMSQTAVEESAHDQPLPEGDAAAHANAMPDLEMGNGYGPAEARAEGGESMAEPQLELGTGNGSEVTGEATKGAPVQPVEMNVPHSHSQQEEVYE